MNVIRCKCLCLYPDDMGKCPSCGRATNENDVIGRSAAYAVEPKQTPVKDWVVTNSEATTSYAEYRSNNARKVKATNPGNNKLVSCSACGETISVRAESCPHCGNPTGVHVCPKCQSIDTTVISGASKAASIFLWGPFAANKVVSKFKCKNCGHKW